MRLARPLRPVRCDRTSSAASRTRPSYLIRGTGATKSERCRGRPRTDQHPKGELLLHHSLKDDQGGSTTVCIGVRRPGTRAVELEHATSICPGSRRKTSVTIAADEHAVVGIHVPRRKVPHAIGLRPIAAWRLTAQPSSALNGRRTRRARRPRAPSPLRTRRGASRSATDDDWAGTRPPAPSYPSLRAAIVADDPNTSRPRAPPGRRRRICAETRRWVRT